MCVATPILWAGITQSVQPLAMSWTVRGSKTGGETRIFASVKTGAGAHSASCKMGTGFLAPE